KDRILSNGAYVYAAASASVLKDAKLVKTDRDRLAEQYGARAVVLLIKSIEAGAYKTPLAIEQLKKDRLLDPLRARADFKRLLTDMDRRPESTPVPKSKT